MSIVEYGLDALTPRVLPVCVHPHKLIRNELVLSIVHVPGTHAFSMSRSTSVKATKKDRTVKKLEDQSFQPQKQQSAKKHAHCS